MSGVKCSNCRAVIPTNSTKCEYCDVEISIIDSAKNISVGNIAQTAKVKGAKIKEKAEAFTQTLLKWLRGVILGFLGLLIAIMIIFLVSDGANAPGPIYFSVLWMCLMFYVINKFFKRYIKD